MKMNPDEIQLLSLKVDPAFPSPALYQALRIAIYNEHKVDIFISMVIEKHGSQAPYSQFAKQAVSRTQQLQSILDELNVVTPVQEWRSRLTVPETLKECCELSVAMELQIIQMYDHLLPYAAKHEIKDLFFRLQADSFNHRLPAFRSFIAKAAADPSHFYTNPQQTNPPGAGFIDTLLDTFAENVEDPAQKEMIKILKQGSPADKGRILGGLVQSLLGQMNSGNRNS